MGGGGRWVEGPFNGMPAFGGAGKQFLFKTKQKIPQLVDKCIFGTTTFHLSKDFPGNSNVRILKIKVSKKKVSKLWFEDCG